MVVAVGGDEAGEGLAVFELDDVADVVGVDGAAGVDDVDEGGGGVFEGEVGEVGADGAALAADGAAGGALGVGVEEGFAAGPVAEFYVGDGGVGGGEVEEGRSRTGTDRRM